MSGLPEWVDKIDYSRNYPYIDKLTRALSIAMEALEEISRASDGDELGQTPEIATRAVICIEYIQENK